MGFILTSIIRDILLAKSWSSILRINLVIYILVRPFPLEIRIISRVYVLSNWITMRLRLRSVWVLKYLLIQVKLKEFCYLNTLFMMHAFFILLVFFWKRPFLILILNSPLLVIVKGWVILLPHVIITLLLILRILSLLIRWDSLILRVWSFLILLRTHLSSWVRIRILGTLVEWASLLIILILVLIHLLILFLISQTLLWALFRDFMSFLGAEMKIAFPVSKLILLSIERLHGFSL